MKHLFLCISIFFISFIALTSWVPSVFAEAADDGYTYYGDSVQEPAASDDSGMLAPVDAGSNGSVSNNGGSAGNSGGEARKSSGGSKELTNPLKSQSIEEFLLKIIDVLLVFALPIIVLYIMYAGYLFVTAQGDSGQVGEARSALLWAVVGGVIILGAKVIVTVIQGTITAF